MVYGMSTSIKDFEAGKLQTEWDAIEHNGLKGAVPPKLQWPREDLEVPKPLRIGILDKAMLAIEARQKQYGESSSHHALTASFWSTYLGKELTSTEVAVMMVLDKIARQRNDPNYEDNYVDMAGYADRAGHNALGV